MGRTHEMQSNFATDMKVPIHPIMLEAVNAAAKNHEAVYWVEEAVRTYKREFAAQEVFFVLTHEAANVLSLQALVRPYQAILCDASSYMYVFGCGALEHYTGSKLVSIKTGTGKLTLEHIRHFVELNENHQQVVLKVVSLSQPTEFGAVYTLEELAKITEFAHEHRLFVHMDGARLANAAAALGCSLQELVRGVDVLTFSGLPHGMLFGEAVVFFNVKFAEDFSYVQCQGMQEAAHSECIAAQFIALFKNKLWLENARHANAMAKLLATQLEEIDELDLAYPIATNKVYARMDERFVKALKSELACKTSGNEVCWTTSYATTCEEVAAAVENIKYVLEKCK